MHSETWVFYRHPPSSSLNYSARAVGEIALMAVDACCRGRGIGTGLIERLMDEFSKSGADLMLLNCPAEAVEAKRLYDKMRFTVRAYHMMKRL